MSKRIVLGVHLSNRMKEAVEFQSVLSKCGCNIRTRVGLHDVADGVCSSAGLILLEMYGDEGQIAQCEAKLNAIEGVNVQKMVFEE